MASTIGNIGKIPELRRRIFFTLICLAVYRIGVFVTTPGVNRVEMKNVISQGGSGTFLGLFNMFSGGALEKMSLFALGIMPYVSSSIILQLLTVVVPTLDRLSKEGEQGPVVRNLKDVELLDVSPVTFPAYKATEVIARTEIEARAGLAPAPPMGARAEAERKLALDPTASGGIISGY